jgi:hypothetical protein
MVENIISSFLTFSITSYFCSSEVFLKFVSQFFWVTLMKGFRLTSENISRGYSVSLAMAGVWQTFGKFTSGVGNFHAEHLIDMSLQRFTKPPELC